uniref:Ig-like domain-containing protein n=1 Tax=Monodelphis domestica TaxID=13616 RepID=F6XY67_MONDO
MGKVRASIFSVLIFLAGISTAQKVSQEQSTMTGQEGETVTLNCKYETSATSYTLFWYKQLLLGEMIFLIRQDSYGQVNTRKDRYLVNLQKTEKFINLTILASQLGDSAMYFCALREPTVIGVTRGTNTKTPVQAAPTCSPSSRWRCANPQTVVAEHLGKCLYDK